MTTVADELAFEAWPRENQEIARAYLFNEIQAREDDIANDAVETAKDSFHEFTVEATEIHALAEQASVALSEARDVTRQREERQKRYADSQQLLDWIIERLGDLKESELRT